MCGIVGAVAERHVEKILIEGLKRLEYRGYDSAGITIIDQANQLNRLRVQGKVGELEKALMELQEAPTMRGNIGIAHTRWATHGVPSERNAHPFISHDEIALVHNGIIENHEKLREFLIKEGYIFTSETDSEVVVHFIHFHFKQTKDLLLAVQKAVAELEGAYALAIVAAHCPDRLLAVRHGSPLVVGKGIGENFVASDVLALLPVAQEFIYLEDRDIIDITRDAIKIYDINGKSVQRAIHLVDGHYDMVDRGEYRHYMRKEIAEQSQALATCIEGRVNGKHISESAFGLALHNKLADIQSIQLVA
ncbi:MAG TPA: class II glutamine amidotransferase [Gammaproteobacteria bacterium]|nr:class II glutamine amidotransferase [Gammaproteobacteria bacterium]